MPQEPEKINTIAKKVLENKGSTSLAILKDTTEIKDSTDSISEAISTLQDTVLSLKEAFPEYDDTQIRAELADLSEELKKKDFFSNDTFNEVVNEVLARTPKAKDGEKGERGTDGLNGLDGQNGTNGLNGLDGKDGSPDTPDQVIEKVIQSKKLIPKRKIEGLEDIENNIKHQLYTGVSETRVREIINASPSSSSGISGSGTANQLTYWVNSTTIGSLTTATYPSLAELSYVKGGTSSFQTQLNSKLSSAIISLNGLTGSSQTFSGSGISISSVGTTHTFTNTGVTSLNSPTGTLSFASPTGAVDAEVNQAATFNWTGPHTFTNDIDFTPTDSTSIFFDMNPDSGASLPSRLRFLNNGGIMSSLEVNVDQGKDIRYLLPKDQPSTGQILYVSDWTDPIATLGFTSASGDVVGPASALNEEMVVFDGDGQHIKGVTSATTVTIGSNSTLLPGSNAIAFDGSIGSYNAHFGSNTNGVNGIEVYNRNTGTSKRTEIIVKSASTTGGDVWGTMTAYPSNYTTGALASRFVIQAGTSQQMVFEVDSNFEWRKSTTAVAKLTTAGFLSGNGSPLAQLHSLQGTLGSDVLRIESVATNDDVRQSTYQNRVATTNNTQTTIHTFTLAATTTYLIEARVTARRTGGSAGTAEDSAGYVIRGTYKNVAGTATLVGTLDTPYTAEDQAGWDATFTVTGATVLCRVTGATNNNITWHMTATVNQLTS